MAYILTANFASDGHDHNKLKSPNNQPDCEPNDKIDAKKNIFGTKRRSSSIMSSRDGNKTSRHSGNVVKDN